MPPRSAGDEDTVLVAGVMRTGQTWLCFMLAHALNARFIEPYCLARGIVFSGHEYVRRLAQGGLPSRAATRCAVVVKTHESPDPHFSLTRRVILITRDPRDVVTSAALRYHVMKTTGSDVEEDAQSLSLVGTPVERAPTLKDRLWKIVYGNRLLSVYLTARRWSSFYRAWRQLPFCHVVRFEDLVKNPLLELKNICDYIEIDVSPEQIAETARALSMGEIKRNQNSTDESKEIGFRKGVVGDFRNHLSRLELAIVRHYCATVAAQHGYALD